MLSFVKKPLLLHSCLSDHLLNTFNAEEMALLASSQTSLLETASRQLQEDLQAFSVRDPASRGRESMILDAYASFKAVLYYRLAHLVWQMDGGRGGIFETLAQKLSNRGKILSGAEIHPAARIGKRFVLDHGFGTVIGETCEIGDDCYILAGVTLGALGIANNPGGNRHPRLGSNVEVGAGARILGPVNIGDNVFICPAAVVCHDIPADTKVRIVNQLQLEKASHSKKRHYFNAFVLNDRLHLVGDVMDVGSATVLDVDFQATNLTLEVMCRELNHVQFKVRNANSESDLPNFPLNLRLIGHDMEVTLMDPPGLGTLVYGMVQPCLLPTGS